MRAVKQRLADFRAPDEAAAQARAWSAVRSAYQERPPGSHRRSFARPAGFLAASVLLVAAAPLIADVRSSTPRPRANAISTTAARALAHPQALVTDEAQNRLLVVDLPRGRIAHSVPVPADPEDIAVSGDGGVVIVVSSAAGKVTILNRDTLRPIKTFGGFDEPHIAEISRDGAYAYITDSRGTLTVIRLSDMKVTATVSVGSGAHHLSFSPTDRTVWIALGENAEQLTTLTTVLSRPQGASPVVNPADPRVVGHFAPGFAAHDLGFSPDGRTVWVTSAVGPDVTAFSTTTHRPLFRVPVGAPPQHLAFTGRFAYLTSGYGSTIEKVDAATGRVITRATAPYGSFELSAADGYVVSASLLRGTLAIYNPDLKLLRVVKLAPATREVAISRP
jgi:DNA-binding beta-propeller fold protein YncE